MNNLNLEELFSKYGLSTIIIAIVCSIIDYVLDKTLLKKAHVLIKNLIPIVLSVIITIIYQWLVASETFIFSKVLVSGLVTGTISIVISITVKKISNGESVTINPAVLLLEGILDGLVEDNKKTEVLQKIDFVLSTIGIDGLDDSELFEKIESIIKDNANSLLKENDLTAIVEIIIKTIKSEKDE